MCPYAMGVMRGLRVPEKEGDNHRDEGRIPTLGQGPEGGAEDAGRHGGVLGVGAVGAKARRGAFILLLPDDKEPQKEDAG